MQEAEEFVIDLKERLKQDYEKHSSEIFKLMIDIQQDCKDYESLPDTCSFIERQELKCKIYQNLHIFDALLKDYKLIRLLQSEHPKIEKDMVEWFWGLSKYILLPSLECINCITGYI